MIALLHPKPRAKDAKGCPECKDGTLYKVGERLCCSRCTYGWTWHR